MKSKAECFSQAYHPCPPPRIAVFAQSSLQSSLNTLSSMAAVELSLELLASVSKIFENFFSAVRMK